MKVVIIRGFIRLFRLLYMRLALEKDGRDGGVAAGD
jgi:hypothetical protein